MTLLSADEARKARSVGFPVLLDSRTENGRPVLRRAGERDVPSNANALSYIAGVQGTSGVVVQFYVAPVSLVGRPTSVEPDLTPYDRSQLNTLKQYR